MSVCGDEIGWQSYDVDYYGDPALPIIGCDPVPGTLFDLIILPECFGGNII
jgi:hypothetical protein